VFFGRNRALFTVIGGTVVALSVIFLLPALRELFHFAPLQMGDVLFALLAMLLGLLWFELVKRFNSWIFKNP
jgi:predicted exporter